MLEKYRRNDQDIFVPINLQQTWDRDKTIRNFSEEVKLALPAFDDQEVNLYENLQPQPSVGFYFPDGTLAFDGSEGEPNAPNNFSRAEVMSYNSAFRESFFILEVISSPYSAQSRVLDRSYIYLDNYYPEYTPFLSSYLTGSQHTDYMRYMSLPRRWEKEQLDQVYVRAMFFNAKNRIVFDSSPSGATDLHLEENLVMPVAVNRADYSFNVEAMEFAFLPFSAAYSRQADTTPRPAVVRPDSYLFDVGEEGLSVGDADTEVTVEGSMDGSTAEGEAIKIGSSKILITAFTASFDGSTNKLTVNVTLENAATRDIDLELSIPYSETSTAKFPFGGNRTLTFASGGTTASGIFDIVFDETTTTNDDGTTTTTPEKKDDFLLNYKYNSFLTHNSDLLLIPITVVV